MRLGRETRRVIASAGRALAASAPMTPEPEFNNFWTS